MREYIYYIHRTTSVPITIPYIKWTFVQYTQTGISNALGAKSGSAVEKTPSPFPTLPPDIHLKKSFIIAYPKTSDMIEIDMLEHRSMIVANLFRTVNGVK